MPLRIIFAPQKFFDYEVESDLEWEEEVEGESLQGTDDEKEKDEDDEYEVDNDFFVPHGHLSDEEMQEDDEEDASPEAQKARLQLMQIEFEEEMKKKTEKLKPRIIGCVWLHNDATEPPENVSPLIWGILKTREMLFNSELPIPVNMDDPIDDVPTSGTPAPKRTKITDTDMPGLIRLVHGNLHSRKFLVDEFTAYRKAKYGEQEGFMEVMHVGSKIKEIAEHRKLTEDGTDKYTGWFVKPEILEKFDLKDLPLPNAWEYTLEPKRSISNDPSAPKSTTTTQLDDDGMRELIRLVHGNPYSRKFLVAEFAAFRKAKYGDTENFKEVKFVGSKIKSIAEWSQVHGKVGWWVKQEALEKYALEDLPLENVWTYTLEVPKRKAVPKPEKHEEEENRKQQPPPPPPAAGNIAKFAKVLTDTEMKKQFEVPKKRVQLLMSVPVGEDIPEEKKNTLISQFLNKPKPEEAKNDEIITID